jgi:2'-hydroxyisoflavone reductase
MRLLILGVLGGRSYVGRVLVGAALARGHEVTVFNDGRTGSELFPAAARRLGDRASGDYTTLATGDWDATIDVSAYIPRHVRQATDAVGERGGRYLFISSLSVYASADGSAELTEDAALLPPETAVETITPSTYGPLKVASEAVVLERYGEQATIVRPGLVVGPHDPYDLFTYWVRRAARGGRMAVPGRLDQPVQALDGRDLANLVLTLVESGQAGTYNAVGPYPSITLAELAHTAAEVGGQPIELVPVDPATAPRGFPLVIDDPAQDGRFRLSADRARAAGLTATPLTDTVAAVLNWDRERGEPPLTAGPPDDWEAQALN